MEVAPSSHHQQQEEGDFPIPMSSTTHGEDHEGNEHHLVNVPHHHHDDHDDRHPHGRAAQKETEVPEEEESCRHRYRYRECMKNHAAALGGNARDGCGEFIPSGTGEEQEEEEEQEDSLICSACACHRNFHRKELLFVLPHEHHPQFDHHHHHHNNFNRTPSRSRNFILGYPAARAATVLPVIMSSHNRLHHVRAGAGGGGVPGPASGSASAKKRIRTKFSQEQREKMLNFAERVGWKIQKQEDCVVQRFCQEIGVKRRVLKVWMHNNKHNLAKKT